jgi:hypothetical protein
MATQIILTLYRRAFHLAAHKPVNHFKTALRLILIKWLCCLTYQSGLFAKLVKKASNPKAVKVSLFPPHMGQHHLDTHTFNQVLYKWIYANSSCKQFFKQKKRS